MRAYVKKFCVRGAMFAWGGPAIMAIVWLTLQSAGVMRSLTVNEAALGVFSTTVMAFIAAGISIVYQMEYLPRAFAALIQASVLYVDYLGIYLLNGWVPAEKIWLFTVIFVLGFTAVWFCIYLSIRHKVNRINRMLEQ